MKDEADARDLITDLLVLMRNNGRDIASELRMAAGNAGLHGLIAPNVCKHNPCDIDTLYIDQTTAE